MVVYRACRLSRFDNTRRVGYCAMRSRLHIVWLSCFGLNYDFGRSSSSSESWFEDVFGFPESKDYDQVRSCFRIEESGDGSVMLHTAPPNGARSRSFHVGKFETPSVSELRSRMGDENSGVCWNTSKKLSFQHIVGDARDLHLDPINEGAVFQAASQMNCLEMFAPSRRPEDGITEYCRDPTQGPACALACPAGTLYRNYFVNKSGQGHGKQLDLLSHVGDFLENRQDNGRPKYWKMKNGYVVPATSTSIKALRQKLESESFNRSAALDLLRVGVHRDTEVVQMAEDSPKYNVVQVYCSALPIAYDISAADKDWEPFARLVLDGLYEATLGVATIVARQRHERVRVFLTKVGGGVFGNNDKWIAHAIGRALDTFHDEPLDVALVHYRSIEEYYMQELKPMHLA